MEHNQVNSKDRQLFVDNQAEQIHQAAQALRYLRHALLILTIGACGVSCHSVGVPILAGSGVAPDANAASNVTTAASPPSTGQLKISLSLDISYTWTVTTNTLTLTITNCPAGRYIVQARTRSGNTEDVLGFSWWESSGFKQATIAIYPFTGKQFTATTYPVILVERQ